MFLLFNTELIFCNIFKWKDVSRTSKGEVVHIKQTTKNHLMECDKLQVKRRKKEIGQEVASRGTSID